MKVELSKAQCYAIADFIGMNILDVIRKDTDIDSLDYVQNLLTAIDVLQKAVAEYEGN